LYNFLKNIILWFLFVFFLYVFVTFGVMKYKKNNPEFTRITYSQFIEKVHNGDVSEVVIDKKYIDGITFSGDLFSTYAPNKLDIRAIEEEWIEHYGIGVQAIPPRTDSMLMRVFMNWFPTILFILVWVYLIRQMDGRGGLMSFGKSTAHLICDNNIRIKFNDVAGIEDAKEELYEIVDFLSNPHRFSSLGAKIPSGILLAGRPGTGKTLLSKAVAGEAGVPFFTIAGSNFVEMFVGIGASRVRDMFTQARSKAPCIIFIDEIDAIGRSRGGVSGNKGVNDEREQTLNQLLVEMDGFDKNEGIVVIGATNRPDVLDPALVRPGRFSRKIYIDLPDLVGREQILKVHTKNMPLASSVDINLIACGTVGLSGADLANLANEAALLAARLNRLLIHMEQFDQAKDRILIGLARKSMVLDYEERRVTAYHEAGHAIVGLNIPGHDPVYKISITPRSMALGLTVFLPKKERYSYSYSFLSGQITSLFGGRVAEEIVFGRGCVTTGASNDLKRATELCRKMVTQWGLSDKIGPVVYDIENIEGNLFIGDSRSYFSEDTAKVIDSEISNLSNKLYKLAGDILLQNIEQLHKMADYLLTQETIGSKQIVQIMESM
jgi:cell division protease FtsH